GPKRPRLGLLDHRGSGHVRDRHADGAQQSCRGQLSHRNPQHGCGRLPRRGARGRYVRPGDLWRSAAGNGRSGRDVLRAGFRLGGCGRAGLSRGCAEEPAQGFRLRTLIHSVIHMPKLTLSLAVNDYDHVRDLLDGRVQAEGIALVPSVLPVEEIFYRTTHYREWDLSEMSLAKYASLRS